MFGKLRVIIAVAVMFGSTSAVLAASNDRVTHRQQRIERIAPPTFESRDAEVPPLPNWGFGCDPDFGPNGYNPCNPAGH